MDMSKKNLKDDSLYTLIFKNSVEGILVSDRNGKIVQANPCCLHIFGYSAHELIGQEVEKLIPQRLVSKHIAHRGSYIKKPQARKMSSGLKLQGLKKNGEEVPLEISLSYASTEEGFLVICFIRDASDTDQLEYQLKRERKLIKKYLEVTNSIFLVIDHNERIRMVNRAGSEVFGVPEDQLKGKNWFDEFIPEQERESVRDIFRKMIKGEIGLTSFHENHIVNSHGEKRLIEWQNTLINDRNGLPEATLSSGIDITEKRETEKARTEALITGQENERRRVAQELHDGLGQSISAIGLNLNALEPELENFNIQFRKVYSDLKSKLNDTLDEVRAISRNLTPRILEDFGLARALEYLFETIDESTDVQMSLNLYGDLSGVDSAVSLGIYRMVQELTNNALRHARSETINVYVTRNENSILTLVEDDGIGFDTKSKPEGMGLSNVQARAELLKGEIHIDSNHQSGTSISIDIPL